MSLINDMLRDLDRRAGLPDVNRRLGGLFNTGPETSTSPLPLLLLVGSCVVAGIGAGYLLFRPAALEVSVAAVPQPSPAPAAELRSLEALPQPVRLEVVSLEHDSNSLSLRLRGSQKLSYAITERSRSGIALRIDGIDQYDGRSQRVDGLSIIQMPDHMLVELALDREADIQLYSDAAGNGTELVLAAAYREAPAPQPVVAAMPAAAAAQFEPGEQLQEPAVAAEEPVLVAAVEEPVLSAALDASLPQRRLDQGSLPQRVARGLTLEQQDRNNSQAAVQMVQGGRVLEAYEALLTFLAQNPEAHLSRETLATILLAQGELLQAAIVVDEGLRLAPNYAPYKKIKARLLLQDGRSADALALLAQLPPPLLADREYHELLATLYQQSGEHAKAIAIYQDLLRADGSEGRWWTALGISLEAQGEVERALASYQQALQQANLDVSVRQYSLNRVRSLSEQ
jgi:tetratricopeptide (TPR) repeat protein